MFCKNCGKEVKEGDQFCGECGFLVKGANGSNNASNQENTYKVEVNIPAFNFSGCKILDIAKMYLRKPLSLFSEFKNFDNVKTAIALVLVLPILYALIFIMYTNCLISSIFSGINKIPDILAKSGIITFQEAILAKTELATSSDFFAFKSQARSMIDNKDLFLNGFTYLIGIIIATTIILVLINYVILKVKMKVSDIFFISSISYIPLVLSVILASLANFISITLGIIIIICGYILSFITLYSGIKQFTDEKNDRIFAVMIILFLIISIILSVTITKRIEASLFDTINLFKSWDHIL